MNTFSINTLGCKVNQYESQQIRELLERLGLRTTESFEKPDLIVVNTCCVTHTASSKSRQYIRRTQKLSPDAVIVVCGCLPTVQIGESTDTVKNILFIKKRDDLAEILGQIVNGPRSFPSNDRGKGALDSTASAVLGRKNCPSGPAPNKTIKPENHSKIKHKKELCNYPQLQPLTSFNGHTRAFLKVQDGCDGFCTYCIVPKTRPIVRSRPVDEILYEVQALVKTGHREIVITGINLGAYGQKSVRRKKWRGCKNRKLSDLLDKIAHIDSLARIRLSSLEPGDVTEHLLDVFCKHSNIMPHLHLSLQSGSDAILKKMCRQYSTEQVRGKIRMIKSRLDRPAITADIIVGFPGETDEDFEQTVALARETGFTKMHIFRFSSRKGTAAAKIKDKVSNQIIKRRSEILRNLDIESGRKYRQQFLGQNMQVLLESDNGLLSGRCERYFKVIIRQFSNTDSKSRFKKNDLLNVRLVENNDNSMAGDVLS